MTLSSTVTIQPASLPAIAQKLRLVRSNDPSVSFAVAEGLDLIAEVLGNSAPNHEPRKRRQLVQLNASLHHLEGLGGLLLE